MAEKLSAGQKRTNLSPTSPRKQLSMRTFFQPPGLGTQGSSQDLSMLLPLHCPPLPFILPLLYYKHFPWQYRGKMLILSSSYEKKTLVFELSHPAVPVDSESIRQPPRPPTTKYVLKRPMNIWSGLWSNMRRGREAFSGWREGGKNKSVPWYNF